MRSVRQSPSWMTLKLKTMLSSRYSYQKAPFPDEQKAMSNVFNPLHTMSRDLFDAVPHDILRWRVSARTSSSTLSKAVLRKHLGRRWKNAFADVLRKKGYAQNGTRIVDGQRVSGLKGTLEILIHCGKGMTNPYAELVRDAQTTIDALEKMQKHVVSKQCQPMIPRSPGRADLEETKLG